MEIDDKGQVQRFILSEKEFVDGKEDVVSLVELVILPDLFGRHPAAYIHKVYTDNAFRNRGSASKLVKEAVELARKNNCYKVFLVCEEKVIPFYKRLGFSKHQEGMVVWLKH